MNTLKKLCFVWSLAAVSAMPALGLPITASDIVSIEGREWAQPDLFKNLSWLDVREQCPFGDPVCTPGSSLNGYDLTGWTWAAAPELKQLFNLYLVAAGYGTDELLDDDTDKVQRLLPAPDFAELFFGDFRPTSNVNGNRPMVIGWQAGPITSPLETSARILRLDPPQEFAQIAANTNEPQQIVFPSPVAGAWFFRPAAVPTSGTISLLLLGLLAFRSSRWLH